MSACFATARDSRVRPARRRERAAGRLRRQWWWRWRHRNTRADPTTYGVSLATPPNNNLRFADGWPTQLRVVGGGQSFCMVLAINTSISGPGVVDGTVVSATIRVGAQTGPMRFVR